MPDGKTPAQIRKLLKQSDTFEKIRRKPKIYKSDQRNTNKNKFKESFGGEGV